MGDQPCFEIWYRSGKSKVRILSAARKHFKLQMTRNASDLFASKLQTFVSRKNTHITSLVQQVRTQDAKISEQK